ETAEGTGGQRRAGQHQKCVENLPEGGAAQEDRGGEHREGSDQQDADLHEAAQELSQDKLIVSQIGHQQQDEGPSVFFLSDGGGGKEGGEEDDQCELEEAEQLKKENAEVGNIADGDRTPPAVEGLPEGDAGDEQEAEVEATDEIMAKVARDREGFAI